jgi:hypothetical protein
MNLPFFRTDYHFLVRQPEHRLVIVRGYAQAESAAEARAVGRPAILAAANVEYLLEATVPVPGVTAPRAPELLK